MNRQYPHNPDHFAGISEYSFNISDLAFVIILNHHDTMPITVGFWNYIPDQGCQIEWHYCNVPKGRNYVCLCNIAEEHWNRMFLRPYNNAGCKVQATMELTRDNRTGLLLQMIPKDHNTGDEPEDVDDSEDEDTDDEDEEEPSTQIPSLQFLCAGQMSLQESDQIRHIDSEEFKNSTYQNVKKFDMLPAEGYMGHTCICDGISMAYNYP